MKTKLGTLFMLLGSALIIAALALFLYNAREQTAAAEAAAEVMPQLVEVIQHRVEEAETVTQPPVEEETAVTLPEARTMAEETINGYGYVGFIGLPTLEMELPILAKWDYRRLQIAPCRYWGDMYSDDLVIMAHNYRTHFGRISELRVGDTVTVTDMDAVTVEYEVVAVDILDPTAVEEMIAGDYDLTLFTCTYGGKSRVTVRCDRKAE